MKTRRWAALFLAVTIVAPPAGASPVPGRCMPPEPAVEYSAGSMSVSLTVDYSECRWWHGRSIMLTGQMERAVLGSFTSEGMGAGTGCIGIPRPHREGRHRADRIDSCTIDLTLPHDEVEAATYSGEFRFPWRGGKRTIEFSYTCSSTPLGASCE